MNSSYFERWGGGTYGQGDMSRQASRAVFFDPYPLNDIGPEIVGGRPREYASPLPEASRNKLNRSAFAQPRSVIPNINNGGYLLPQYGGMNSSMMPATSPYPVPAYPVPPYPQQPFPPPIAVPQSF